MSPGRHSIFDMGLVSRINTNPLGLSWCQQNSSDVNLTSKSKQTRLGRMESIKLLYNTPTYGINRHTAYVARNYLARQHYELWICRAGQDGDLFSESSIKSISDSKTLPSSTADIAWGEAQKPLSTITPKLDTIMDSIPPTLAASMRNFLATFGIKWEDAGEYYPLSTYNIKTSSTVRTVAKSVGLDIEKGEDFKQLLPADVPSTTAMDLAETRQSNVDEKLCNTMTINLDEKTSMTYKERRDTIFSSNSWIKDFVFASQFGTDEIPKPNEKILDAIAESSIQELITSGNESGERYCQFLCLVLIDRFTGAVPKEFMVRISAEKDKTTFAKDFSIWLTGFIGQENKAARYLRELHTYLRINAQSSDKYDFGCTQTEKRACLTLKGLAGIITKQASELTSSKRLEFSKAKLQAIRELEESSIAKLERDFPVFRISNITFQDIPLAMQTSILDTITAADKNAGQRAKALTLRAWKALEYAAFISKAKQGGFKSEKFDLLCEKPLKNIMN